MSRTCNPPIPPMATPPAWVPKDACDCHVHIFGPYSRFPLAEAEGRSYTPAETTVDHLNATLGGMGFGRAVIVNATGYNFDNSSLEAALEADPKRLRGIAVLPPDTSRAKLQRLNDLGVRGVRINLYRHNGVNVFKGGAGLDTLHALGPAMAEMGWHIQAWITTRDLPGLLPELQKYPGKIVVDVMARVIPSQMPTDPGFALFCDLLRNDRFYTKLCGWDRMSERGGDFSDVDAVGRKLLSIAEDKLVWGSDWPHVAYFDKSPPAEEALLAALHRVTDSDAQRKRVLVDNPAALYGFD